MKIEGICVIVQSSDGQNFRNVWILMVLGYAEVDSLSLVITVIFNLY